MINAVLVGCGAMSKAWLDVARQIDGLAIVGLVDLDADRARARAREYDLDHAVDRHQPRPRPRPDQAATPCSTWWFLPPAARLRFPPLPMVAICSTEKPLADSTDNARAIIDAARRAGRIHAVVQNRR